MMFTNKEMIRDVVKDYAMENRKNVLIKKNDSKRIMVKCVDGFLVVEGISANVESRLCVKHLYGNWKKKHPGLELKEVLWAAARATTIPTWERVMLRMKEMKEDAWKDMLDVLTCHWSRSHFRTYSKCNLQVNNMCEAFNRAILEHREKLINTLLEDIKHYITKRMTSQKELLHGYTGSICHRIQLVIKKNKKKAQGWSPTWHGDDDLSIFGVTNGIETYCVNLKKEACSCRKWDLSVIPCCHAISLVRRAITQRNKMNDEPRNPNILPRRFSTITCAKCGSTRHNKRSCKGKRAADRAIPNGGNKRKKTKKVKGGKGTKKSKEKQTEIA
ncbi:hypothetical protein KIW84_052569 [Lathyrus oleraceus]|uniref:SWIM-type domain-containing protein n=1 Tax=Pisum sativum TaxID=3888 RepID=A0A9D4WQ67_PEA|nr:hypothetical protein KIW84_052569 [Pisum sativum]